MSIVWVILSKVEFKVGWGGVGGARHSTRLHVIYIFSNIMISATKHFHYMARHPPYAEIDLDGASGGSPVKTYNTRCAMPVLS